MAGPPISPFFLLSPPNVIGYIEDRVFQVEFTAYLDQKIHVVAPLEGRYFGWEGERLDPYGANLVAAKLPGRGHRELHVRLQSLVTVVGLPGVEPVNEASVFLVNKDSDPYITRCIDHVAQMRCCPYENTDRHSIIPDVHTCNYPISAHDANDSGATTLVGAFFI